jgi:hypothetical protein
VVDDAANALAMLRLSKVAAPAATIFDDVFMM